MPRAAPTNPVFLPPEKPGVEEGDICRRDGCCGRLEHEEPENCACHINPPCAACTNVMLYCPDCGWREDDDE